MNNLEKHYITIIENTSNYGLVKENLTYYDEQKILGEYLLNYRIYKIRCRYEKNIGLSGIQIIHKDRITSQEITTIDISKNEYEEEDEIIFDSKEMINEITLWKDDALRGFKIKTNKGRLKDFGWCEGTKVELDEFDNGNNYLVGFFLGFHIKEGIQCMGYYYINKRNYYQLLNLGFFQLRVKLKKEEFKKKIEAKLNQLDYSDQVLFKACCLPDNPFFGIFKYIFV